MTKKVALGPFFCLGPGFWPGLGSTWCGFLLAFAACVVWAVCIFNLTRHRLVTTPAERSLADLRGKAVVHFGVVCGAAIETAPVNPLAAVALDDVELIVVTTVRAIADLLNRRQLGSHGGFPSCGQLWPALSRWIDSRVQLRW